MIARRFHMAAVLVALLWTSDAATSAQSPRPLRVSFTPVTIRQGEVVRVEIENAGIDEGLSATLLDQETSFELDEREGKWRAFFGIDLETEPGAYTMEIQRRGSTMPAQRTVRVVPRKFRVRRLTVSREFVDPPPETLEQIALDSRTLADAYARISPRQWTRPFVPPVEGKASSNFGTRSYYNGQRRSPHAGVDFSAAPGTPIRAANHGTIALAAPLYFTGNTVVIDHGGRLFSVFAHLSAFNVKAGDVVAPHTIVGLVGDTGRVTGPHLHWSVRLNGARVDPLSLIAATAE